MAANIHNSGAWVTNIVILVLIKLVFSIVPGITPEASWTLTNLGYNAVRLSITAPPILALSAGLPSLAYFEFENGSQD